MAENKKSKIKVVVADAPKRQAVMLNKEGKVLAEGTTSIQLAKKIYGGK